VTALELPEQVLVVDDDESIRRLIARMVTDAGHSAHTVAGAAEARRALAETGFSLVICDLSMPGESGRELLAWIRVEHPDVAILMATGTDDRQIADAVLALGAYGYLVKPFKRNEVAINVANALRRRRLEIENRGYRELLEQRVAERTAELQQAVLRLEQARAEIARSREETINRLVLAIEFRSLETGQHVERIGHAAGLVAARLGLDTARCEMIRTAAPLHDVGKIGIPDVVLLKPGALTDEERREVEEHAALGFKLLSGAGSALLELAAEIAWTHHERIDGMGYPRRLAGEAIPIAGRITAVADVFDALTHDRVYRPALPVEEAVGIMRADSGTHFDPAVLTAFEASLGELLD
jgi:putative two-component system response regulator